mgnify:CR=1 FL=1
MKLKASLKQMMMNIIQIYFLVIQENKEKALVAIQNAQERIEALSQETSERLAKLQLIAEDLLDEQKESLKKGYSEAKDTISSS